jgi:hypothetical protein
MSLANVWAQAVAYLMAGPSKYAKVTGDVGPVLPLVISTGVNDTFVYTPASTGVPETFTMAPGTLTLMPNVISTMGAAIGSAHGESFGAAAGGLSLNWTATNQIEVSFTSSYSTVHNGDKISEGNGGAAALGFTANPDVASGGTWGNGAGIDFLQKVFQYPEVQTPDTVFFPKDQPGITTSVVIWTWITDGNEHRIAPGPDGPPPNGVKWVPYLFHANCVLRAAYQTDGSGDSVQLASADNTSFIDSFIAAVRFSRNAGGPPVGSGDAIFAWGEGEGQAVGGTDVKWHSDGPVILEGSGVAGMVEIRTRFDIWTVEAVAS